MDVLWTKIADQAPSLVVLALITFAFLRHLRGRDAVIESIVGKHDCREARGQELAERQTSALDRNTEAFHRIERVLDRNGAR